MPDLLDGLPLIDHHCHGIRTDPLERTGLESDLTEAAGPGRWHGSLFDSQSGMAVLRWCAPLLDLPAHCDPGEYVARRAELGSAEVNRRLMSATGTGEFLVDTGYLGDELTSPAELAELAGGRGREIVRLEQVAESVLSSAADAGDYADSFGAELIRRCRDAVGVKSIAAYRCGLDLDPARPSDVEVRAAAARWAASVAGSGAGSAAPRLEDAVLIRFGIWTAVELGMPVQVHVGYGDSDLDLLRCDPLCLAPLLRATQPLGVPVLLLHNYPFQRHAGYLAQVFDHVFVDVGLATHNTGTGAETVLAELLELAPFGSVLFSTDAFALSELFVTGTALFRRALARFLDRGIADDAWTATDAERIARMIGAGNAERAYRLNS